MKRSTIVAIVIASAAAAVLCLVCLGAAVIVFRPEWLPLRIAGRDHVLLRLPGRRDENDLMLLRLGQELEQGTLLVEDAGPAAASLAVRQDDVLRPIGDPHYGGFVPGQAYLLVQHLQEGEIRLERFGLRAVEPRSILESAARGLEAVVLADGQTIFLHELTDGRERCYLSRDGGPAERVARGDECQISSDGSTLLVADRSGDGLTLTALNSDGSGSIELLTDEEGVESYQLSGDGSRLAYLQMLDDGRAQVIVLSRQDGSTLFESEAFYSLPAYGFAPRGHALYLIGETEDVELTLYAFDGEAQRVAQAIGLQAGFSQQGEHLVYLLSDEDGAGTLYVHPMAGGDEVEIVSGGALSFAMLPSPERILVLEQVEDEVTLYSAAVQGTDLVELFDETGLAQAQALVIPGEPWLYLVLTDGRGDLSLWMSPLDRPDGRMVVEDYGAFHLLDRSTRATALLLAASPDPSDALGLYSVSSDGQAEPVLLDDDFDEVPNAAFTRRGNQVIYTAFTGPDEFEVRRLPADGSRPPEVLYPDAALADIEWDRLSPFDGAAVHFETSLTVTSFCPGVTTVSIGESLEDELTAGAEVCYRLHLDQAQDLRLTVIAGDDFDSIMSLYDRDGNLLQEDDDSGPGLNPQLRFHFDEGGTYFVTVRGYSGGESGPFTLTVSEAVSIDAAESARPLPFNERLRGAVTAADELYLAPYDIYLYGVMYYFEAQAQDWIEIEVRARSIGSSLVPSVGLFDEAFSVLAVTPNEEGGDAHLALLIPSDGRYYVLVTTQTEDYGTEEDYFFDITLTLGTAPEAGGGPIAYGQTDEGYVLTGEGDRWTFQGSAGDIVTISMGSELIDCYLELLDPAGATIASDDDSGGNRDALINGFRLPSSGTYTIIASGYGGATGPYTLTLQPGEIGPGGGTIAPGQTVSGTLALVSGDEWTFSGTSGQVVTISMYADFDTYLELYGPDGSLLTEDDDSGEGTQSRIADFTLPQTGTYTIVARSLFHETGLDYTLRLE
ncbi:MAG: pre-peptidase C-terminal domain-containing protein [Chloroflexota bacterium]